MLKRNFISTEEYNANVKNPVSVINADTRDNYSDYVSAALGEYAVEGDGSLVLSGV